MMEVRWLKLKEDRESRIGNRYSTRISKNKSSDGENQGLDLDHCDDVIEAIRQYNIAA